MVFPPTVAKKPLTLACTCLTIFLPFNGTVHEASAPNFICFCLTLQQLVFTAKISSSQHGSVTLQCSRETAKGPVMIQTFLTTLCYSRETEEGENQPYQASENRGRGEGDWVFLSHHLEFSLFSPHSSQRSKYSGDFFLLRPCFQMQCCNLLEYPHPQGGRSSRLIL